MEQVFDDLESVLQRVTQRYAAITEEPSKKHPLVQPTFQQECQNERRKVLPFSH